MYMDLVKFVKSVLHEMNYLHRMTHCPNQQLNHNNVHADSDRPLTLYL